MLDGEAAEHRHRDEQQRRDAEAAALRRSGAPIQPESGCMIALASEYELIAQVPSCGLTPRLPAMCGTDTLTIVMSSTSMNVANATAIVSSASGAPCSGAQRAFSARRRPRRSLSARRAQIRRDDRSRRPRLRPCAKSLCVDVRLGDRFRRRRGARARRRCARACRPSPRSKGRRAAGAARAPSRSSEMRTGTRCTTLIQLPEAFCGGSSANAAPVPGARPTTRP